MTATGACEKRVITGLVPSLVVVALLLGGIGVYAHGNTATRRTCPEGYGPVARDGFEAACFRPAVSGGTGSGADFTPLPDPDEADAAYPELRDADFTSPLLQKVNGSPSVLDPDAARLWWYGAGSALVLALMAVGARAMRARPPTP